MVVILDCGTTNTKCFLIESDNSLAFESYSEFGVKENLLDTNRQLYKNKIRDMVINTLQKIHRDIQDVSMIIAFGMISSDLGFMELPHINTPVGLKELQKEIYLFDSSDLFGNNVKFYIIRGTKNFLKKERSLENVEICDFMRGEETQIMGILEEYRPSNSFNVIFFTSHFKIVHVTKDGKIQQSMTTMSGQIFDCLLHHTIVGKSIQIKNKEEGDLKLEDIIKIAHQIMNSKGMIRALLSPRFMELFTDMTASERRTYIDAVLSLDDLKSMEEYYGNGKYQSKEFYFVGHEDRCQICKQILLSNSPNADITILSGKDKTRDISIKGALKVLNC